MSRNATMSIDLEGTIESLLAWHPTTRVFLHIAIVATTLGVAVTGFIDIDVTINEQAMFAPALDRQTLHVVGGGVVERIQAANGAIVAAGDTLLVLVPSSADHARAAAEASLRSEAEHRADLQKLVAMQVNDSTQALTAAPTSAAGKASLQAALVEWREGTTQVLKAQQAGDRTRKLLQKGFAMPAELEAAEHALAMARDDRVLAFERRHSEWATELASTEQQILALQRDISSSAIGQSDRFIIAPLAGTIEDLAPITRGSILRAGDVIATISPNDGIIAESFVPPRDVSYIRKGMPARLIVEGFDVQTWGVIDATVISVASDVSVINNQPVFRVRLKLNAEELKRSSDGKRASVKRGLRAQARFVVGRKRIVDLVRHRMSEWLDPSAPSPG